MRGGASLSLRLTLGLVLGLGALGGAVAAALTLLPASLQLAAVLALLLPLAAALSGQPRRFLLWGLLLAVPLDLSKFFEVLPHMGGEYGFRLELSDLFLVLLGADWLAQRFAGQAPRLRLTAAGRLWLLLILLGVGSVAFGVYRRVALMEVVRMVKVLLLFLIVANHLRRREELLAAGRALVVGALLLSIYGLLQWGLGATFGLALFGEAEGPMSEPLGLSSVSRVGSLVGHPNMFSGYLVMALPVAAALLFGGATRGTRRLCFVTLLTGSAALIATLSRGGWVAFALAFTLVFTLSALHRRLRLRSVLVRATLLLALAVLALAFGNTILDRLLLSNPENVLVRFELMDISWRMIQERPLFGFGLNSWAFEMAPYSRLGVEGVHSVWGALLPPVHNLYLLVATEQGLLGLLLLLLLIGALLRVGLTNLRETDDSLFALNLGLLAGLLAILVHGLADWVLRTNPLLRMFWLYGGLLVALSLWRRRGALLQAAEQADELLVVWEPAAPTTDEPRWPGFGAVLLLSGLVAGAGCSGATDSAAPAARVPPAQLDAPRGLGYWPSDYSDEALHAALTRLREGAEIATVQLPAFANEPPRLAHLEHWLDEARAAGLALHLALEPFDDARRAPRQPPSAAPLCADPAWQAAFRAEVLALAARHQPEYLNLGVEANLYLAAQPEDARAFLALCRALREELAALSPATQAFCSLQYEVLAGRGAGIGWPGAAQWPLLDELLLGQELLALSSYPLYLESPYRAERVPAGHFDELRHWLAGRSAEGSPALRVLLAEIGFYSSPEVTPASSLEEQARFVRRLPELLAGLPLEAVCWVSLVDLRDQPSLAALRASAPQHFSLALLDAAQQPKPAWQEWLALGGPR
ncbi:MAG: O-antigen ligase family protein [Planctomycetota bacterium]